MRALRALIFDFDHTLADFGRWVDWPSARAQIADLYARAGLDVDRVMRERRAFSVLAALDSALAEQASRPAADDVRDAAFRILDEYECAGAARASLLAGAAAALHGAAAEGLALAIVSANAERAIRATLARLGVERLFAAIVGRSTERPPKPEPAMHHAALQMLACPPEAALAVGDSPNDILAAAAANVLAVGVIGGEGDTEQLFAAGACWVLADLTALPSLLALWKDAAGE